jgi:hypothetical protein
MKFAGTFNSYPTKAPTIKGDPLAIGAAATWILHLCCGETGCPTKTLRICQTWRITRSAKNPSGSREDMAMSGKSMGLTVHLQPKWLDSLAKRPSWTSPKSGTLTRPPVGHAGLHVNGDPSFHNPPIMDCWSLPSGKHSQFANLKINIHSLRTWKWPISSWLGQVDRSKAAWRMDWDHSQSVGSDPHIKQPCYLNCILVGGLNPTPLKKWWT